MGPAPHCTHQCPQGLCPHYNLLHSVPPLWINITINQVLFSATKNYVWKKLKHPKRTRLAALQVHTEGNKNLKQEWLLAFWNKIQTHKRFKIRLFARTKHNMWIFGAIPSIKPPNDIQTTIKWWKMRWKANPLTFFWLSYVQKEIRKVCKAARNI